MDCILKLEDTGQTAKANKLQLCPACKRTPKGKGQKKLKSKQGQTRANTDKYFLRGKHISDPVSFTAKY